MLIAYGNVESVEIPSKPGEIVNPGQVWRKPVYRPGGGRHKGGMNFTQVFVRNVGTHGLMLREYIKRKNHKIRVPMQPWGQIRL